MIAYFDCFSGISGDMTLGAFFDLGVPVEWLRDRIETLPLTGFEVLAETVSRNGIQAKSVEVRVNDRATSRHYEDIKFIIEKSPLSSEVKQRSLDIFERIADAEALIHGCPKEKVHFHEVGGIDALVDIVGTALCVDYLTIESIIASPIPVGRGFVDCQHGVLPVPAPATLAILKGIPVYGTKIPHELVTPTGAAIIATLAESFEEMPDMIIDKIGYGAGKRELKSQPNLLRIILGLTFMLFLPGYVIVSALFPKDNVITTIERIALIMIAQVAISPLIPQGIVDFMRGVPLISIESKDSSSPTAARNSSRITSFLPT